MEPDLEEFDDDMDDPIEQEMVDDDNLTEIWIDMQDQGMEKVTIVFAYAGDDSDEMDSCCVLDDFEEVEIDMMDAD
jgi:hypothetical protein